MGIVTQQMGNVNVNWDFLGMTVLKDLFCMEIVIKITTALVIRDGLVNYVTSLNARRTAILKMDMVYAKIKESVYAPPDGQGSLVILSNVCLNALGKDYAIMENVCAIKGTKAIPVNKDLW